MHGLPGDFSLIPSHSHSRLSPLVSAGSCVVRVCRGGSCCLGCSGACSPCLTWVLGVLSRWLVHPCGVMVLTVLCGLLSPFRVLCCCPCPWARAHDWLRVGFLATWGRVLGGLRGCSTRVIGGVELLAEGCWPIRGVFGCGCDRVGVTGAGCPLEERVSHAGAFSGSCWCPHRGVVILGRQGGCGVSWGLGVSQVPFPGL